MILLACIVLILAAAALCVVINEELDNCPWRLPEGWERWGRVWRRRKS